MTDTQTPTEQAPQRTEMPFAYVQGEAVTTLPKDLYIPPDALEVFLEAFEGPLDLLLYLIRRQNLDVLDIPISEITRQYMECIELMKELRLELAAEYLVMAAMLAEIKSRMLLPRPVESEDEEDPRAELVRRLQEYERYKQAAEDIDRVPRVGRTAGCRRDSDAIAGALWSSAHLRRRGRGQSGLLRRAVGVRSAQRSGDEASY